MSARDAVASTAHASPGVLRGKRMQRKCACAESKASCERCAGPSQSLQRKASTSPQPRESGISHQVEAVIHGSGQPLSAATRAYMEPRFGEDFSLVRVHADEQAARSVRSVDAHAYTVGNRIAFDNGRFAPDTTEGRKLLAHELAHVVQQRTNESATLGEPTELEHEADAISAAVENGGGLPAIGKRSPRRLSRAPNDPAEESEEEKRKKRKKLREDDVDRSYLGLGSEDQKPVVDTGTKGAYVPPNEPISTAKDSKQAFDLNLAQRGFDFVGELHIAIDKNKTRLALLNQQKAATADVAERGKLEKEIAKIEGWLERDNEKLRLVSTPQLKDDAALVKERDVLAKELDKKLTPFKKAQVEKKIAALNEQIDAVKFAKANPDQAAPLAAYDGTALGSAKMHTFVTIQVTTADGKVLLFQARNVPGGDHAEDVVLRQLETSGLTKNSGLAGAKMVIFGDQEVCKRCQKRVPEFAEKYGIREVDGFTTHAPALKRDGMIDESKTVGAKTTAVETSDPAKVKRRAGADETVELTQKRTFSWRNPQAPDAGAVGGDATHPSTLKSGSDSDHAKNTATLAKTGATPGKLPGAGPASHGEADTPTVAKPTQKAAPGDESTRARTPGGRAKAATSALNKADMALAAIRDFKRYKQEYLAQGLSENEASMKAAARAGVTLQANLKGGPVAAVVNAANAFDNATKSGQGKGEALATTIGTLGGGLIANEVAPTGPVGAAVQLINTGAQVVGAPQPVQDVTYGAAELVPSSIVSTTITAGARSWYNLGEAAITGDARGIDKMGKDIESGGMGPWLQGYFQVTGIVADVAAGDNFTKALDKAGKAGKGSWADRVGSGMADAAFDLGQDKEVMAGKYGPVVGGTAIALNIAAGLARGEDMSKAYGHAQRDFNEGNKALKAKISAKSTEIKAAVRAKVDSAKKEAGKMVDATTKVIAGGVQDVKHKVTETVAKIETGVNTMIDDTTKAVARHVEKGKAFVDDKLSAGKAWVKGGIKRLWGN